MPGKGAGRLDKLIAGHRGVVIGRAMYGRLTMMGEKMNRRGTKRVSGSGYPYRVEVGR